MREMVEISVWKNLTEKDRYGGVIHCVSNVDKLLVLNGLLKNSNT